MRKIKMFKQLKALWNSLFGKDTETDHSKEAPYKLEPTDEVVAETPVEEPVTVQPPPLPTDPVSYWPFPSAPPHEANKPVKERKKRNPPKVAAVTTPKVPAESVKKTPKQIAADRRKAAAVKDRNRAKGKK